MKHVHTGLFVAGSGDLPVIGKVAEGSVLGEQVIPDQLSRLPHMKLWLGSRIRHI